MLTFKEFQDQASAGMRMPTAARMGQWHGVPSVLIEYHNAGEYMTRVAPDLLTVCEALTPLGATVVRVAHGTTEQVLGFACDTSLGEYVLQVFVGGVEPRVDTNYGLNPSGQAPDAG